jgi:hypothetical protein
MKRQDYGNFSVADLAISCDGFDLHIVLGPAKEHDFKIGT